MRALWRGFVICILWVLWIVAIAPFWFWTALVAEVLLVWLRAGKWPLHGVSPAMDPLSQQRFGALITAVLSIAAVTGVLFFFRRRTIGRQFLIAGLGLALLWAVAFLLLRFDPGGIVDWALD